VDTALDPDEWMRLRRRGLARAEEFTWDRVAELHGEVYARILGPRDAGAERPPEVVLVAYGSPDLLSAALQSVAGVFPVTVVDNSSSPAVRAVAEEHGAHYVDPGANLGFGGGVNVALRSLASRGLSESDVLLLNPDARIDPPGVLRMQRLMHGDRRIAVVGASQSDPADHSPARVWWPFPHPLRMWVEAVGLGRLNRARQYVIGSVILLRSEAIADVGEFDERFFLYAEETDWQRRAVGRGWRIALADVDASHVGAGTSADMGIRDRYFHASTEKYMRKHFGVVGWQLYRSAVIAGAGVRSIALRGQAGKAAAARLALYVRGPAAAEPPRPGVRHDGST
jgi:GT2 family glycosyltransferase